MNGEEVTTIAIKMRTKDRLDAICWKKSTYDERINKLLDEYEKCTDDRR